MTIELSSQLTRAGDLLMEPWGWASTLGGFVVLTLVDRLPPVQRRYRLELEIRDSAFAAGRAYEREVLGLPPALPARSRTGGVARVAASGHPTGGARHPSARRRHLHLV